MVSLFGVKIDQPRKFNRIIHCYRSIASYQGLKKMHRYMKENDRVRFATGRLLLLWIFVQKLNYSNLPAIYDDQYSRPFQRTIPILDFNISHSCDWVICGISNQGRIGVDIEKVRKDIDILSNHHYFSYSEVTNLNKLIPSEQITAFFQLWTLKEAFLKADGSTVDIPLDSFDITFSADNKPVFNPKSNCPKPAIVKFQTYQIDTNYKMAVCCFGPAVPEKAETVKINKLFF